MARKTIDITISSAGRDIGKVFRISEMPATQGEEWALRAVNGIARSGFELPSDFRAVGMVSIAAIGLKAFLGMAWSDLKPLMGEMFDCIKIVMPAGVRSLVEDDIEEAETRLFLRKEVFELHTGFFSRAARWTSSLKAAASDQESDSPSTSTSP